MSHHEDEERTLCDWEKDDIREELELLAKLVSKPAYVCRKCARAAAAEAVLCKPIPLPPVK